MSGTMSMLALGGGISANVILGATDDPVYPGDLTGYRNTLAGPAHGTATPDVWAGAPIFEIQSNYVGTYFRVIFGGVHPQNFFSQLGVYNAALGVSATLASAAAGYQQTGSTYWTWTTTGLPILTPGYTFQLNFA